MSRVFPTKPPFQKDALTRKAERKYMDSFRGAICESCGINDGTVVGAHFNFEGGGMGYRAPGVVAGLCGSCHDLADGRTNAPKSERVKVWLRVLAGMLRNRARVKMSLNETGE